MTDATPDSKQEEEEVKSFHLTDKKHSFHLEGHGDGPAEPAAEEPSAKAEEEVKSFHPTSSEHSFRLRGDGSGHDGSKPDSKGEEEEVKSFHLTGGENSFKKK